MAIKSCTILTDLLVNSWQRSTSRIDNGHTYNPTTQWQDAENTGLGEIDTARQL
jgi:hypothetical protein